MTTKSVYPIKNRLDMSLRLFELLVEFPEESQEKRNAIARERHIAAGGAGEEFDRIFAERETFLETFLTEEVVGDDFDK